MFIKGLLLCLSLQTAWTRQYCHAKQGDFMLMVYYLHSIIERLRLGSLGVCSKGHHVCFWAIFRICQKVISWTIYWIRTKLTVNVRNVDLGGGNKKTKKVTRFKVKVLSAIVWHNFLLSTQITVSKKHLLLPTKLISKMASWLHFYHVQISGLLSLQSTEQGCSPVLDINVKLIWGSTQKPSLLFGWLNTLRYAERCVCIQANRNRSKTREKMHKKYM